MHQPITVEYPYQNLSFYLNYIGISETDIAPVIASMNHKNSMIIYDCCGIINKISEKEMARGPVFHPPTIFQRVNKYNGKHGSTPEVEPID